MKDIVIVGSGGQAKDTVLLIESINKISVEWNILGYVDVQLEKKNGKHKVVLNDHDLINYPNELNIVFGIGDPALIMKLYHKYLQNKNLIFPNIISPQIFGDFENIKLGIGNVICASNHFSTDIEIGNFNIFNVNSTIGHDSRIGNFNVINPSCNISGGVVLQNEVLVGTGSQILQYLEIASKSIIGAGSVVTKNISEAGVYVGIPAKRIK